MSARLRRIAILLLLLTAHPLLQATSLEGQVLAVPAGNRLIVTDSRQQRRLIQLAGVAGVTDAPASRIARRWLTTLLAGRHVRVIPLAGLADGATLGFVLYGGADVSLRLLGQGMADLQPEHLDGQHLNRYRQARNSAYRRRLGLWQSTSRHPTTGDRR